MERLEPSVLHNILETYYRLIPVTIKRLKGGWAALAFRVDARTENGRCDTYFMKVYEKHRASTEKLTAGLEARMQTLRELAAATALATHVAAPVQNVLGKTCCEDGSNLYLLFRYVEGHTIGDKGLTPEQVYQLAQVLAGIHLHPLSTGRPGTAEDFGLPFGSGLRSFLEGKGDGRGYHALKARLAPFAKALRKLVDKSGNLAAALRGAGIPYVLCHTGIHHWNLMDTGATLVVVDFDGLKAAPAEADLFSIRAQRYADEFFHWYSLFRPGYRPNRAALDFYSCRRKLEDIWEWMEQLLFDNLDEAAYQAADQALLQECGTIEELLRTASS